MTPTDPEIKHNQGFKTAYQFKKGLSQAVKIKKPKTKLFLYLVRILNGMQKENTCGNQ